VNDRVESVYLSGRPAMTRRLWIQTSLLAAALVIVGISGCGQDPMARQPVRGTIDYQGKPIKFGSVRFEPAAGQKTAGSADIRDGRFSLDRANGLAPGKYKVWVQAFDRISDSNAMPGSEGPPPKDILPQKYMDQPATDFEVKEVKDDKPNELALPLK
jgi:hypothetical protein